MGDAEIGCRYPVGRDMTGGGMPGAIETRSEPPTAGARQAGSTRKRANR